LLIPQALKVPLMLTWLLIQNGWNMSHIPLNTKSLSFSAGDDALAYLVYFQLQCGVRAAVEALCFKEFRYSSLLITSPGDPYRHGELWCFLQEFGARKPPKGWNIPNHEWPMMIGGFQSEQDRWFSYFFSLRGCGECST